MSYNYLLETADYFSYLNKKNELISKNDFQSALIDEFSLDEVPLSNVLESLDTYSFLSEKKVVIVKNVELLDIENKSTKHFLKYLENPDPNKLLIMLSSSLNNKKKITKELKDKATYIKIEDDPTKIIKEELKNYNMDRDTINLLLEYTNNSIDRIKSECDKLKLYKEEDKEIKLEDIKKICFKGSTDTTNLVFDLVKYISEKNKRQAIITYKLLHENNTDDLGIMALLESQLRLLKQVSMLMDRGEKKEAIASILKVHPFRVSKTMELLRSISDKEINSLIKELASIDYKIKSGLNDSKKPLDMLILNL